MKCVSFGLLTLLAACGCETRQAQPTGRVSLSTSIRGADQNRSLAEARRGFATKLIRQTAQGQPVPEPPPEEFRIVRYESSAGKLAAYVSRTPEDGRKHAAIIWITGGFGNDIGSTAWTKFTADNDQSASTFRQAGIVTMYPSFRGGNDNPGFQEGFFGEVDDVLAAAEFLTQHESVDPDRIYLGGHSTGGTLALLAAESSNRFRAVFSFGPVDDVAGYGADALPFALSDRRELELRAPGRWLHAIHKPVFVFEGVLAPSNVETLHSLAQTSKNSAIHFHPVNGANHFSILAPMTRLIADKILADSGATTSISFTDEELSNVAR